MKTANHSTLAGVGAVISICNKLFPNLASVLVLAAAFAMPRLASAGVSYTWNVSSGNWSSPGSWTPATSAAGPTSIDFATFGNNFESGNPNTINNTVDSSRTISYLSYSNIEASGSYVYPVTSIPSGTTLTVTNFFQVGGIAQTAGSGAVASYAYFVGGGTLNVTGPGFLVTDGGSSSGGQPCAYLYLQGLTNFVYNNTKGYFGVATNAGPNNSQSGGNYNRMAGTVTLASGRNSITAGLITLGAPNTATVACGMVGPTSLSNFGTEPNGAQNYSGPIASGNPSVLTLGPGTNILNSSAIVISAFKNPFIVTNSGGGLRIRGVTGADSDANVNITVGNRDAGGGTGQTTGWLLFNGSYVDIKANTFILGKNTDTPSTSAAGGNGLLEFDNGTISANSFLMADNSGANNGAVQADCNGEIVVGAHGTLNIGAGQLFALATSTETGPSAGFLIVSNGLVNCLGPIVMGASSNSVPPSSAGYANGIIQLIGAGTLNMGPNSYVGSLTNPITGLLLDTNSVFSLSIPNPGYTNVCVSQLAWPSPDTSLTLSIAAIPAGITNGETFPFLSYNTLTPTVGYISPTSAGVTTNFITNDTTNTTLASFNPNVVLPIGVGGYMYASNNNVIYLQLTAGAGVGIGGVNLLTNGYFIYGASNWVASGSGATIVNTSDTYGNTSVCAHDGRTIVPLPNTGTNVAKLTGTGVSTGSTNIWSQTLPVYANSQIVPGSTVLSPGAVVTIGSSDYLAHEDAMSGADSFYYEVDFLDANSNLVAAYESTVLTNLGCSSPIVDQWSVLAVTNQMQITGGVNTGAVVGSVSNALVTVPPQSAAAVFKAVLVQQNAGDPGSVYFSGANIGFLSSPVRPSLSSVNPNLVTLCTNAFLTCVATSSITTVSSVQVTAVTTTLAGSVTNTTIYTNNVSAGLTVTGLGTSVADISLALTPNTIYQSVAVAITDADGLSVNSAPVNFDTLSPNLVIEASDFNCSGGSFIDTPSNGGFALYQGRVGITNVDEYKAYRTNTQSYYRPLDATIIQAANPAAPSGTEQKFVTAAANGDNTDVEVAIAYDTAGDWQNYTRTVASSGESIQPGIYNVFCYLATSGSGNQVGFYQVTNGTPNTTNQLTSFIGNFGGSSFSDNSYNNFVYAPLVDSFGNRIELALTNLGAQTFRAQIAPGVTPNVGFYMFVPYVPELNPIFLNISPTNGVFEPTDSFAFTVGQANGAAISTDDIGVTINGFPITSGLAFTPLAGGGWNVNYPILSNNVYSIVINVTNQNGYTATYSESFNTFDINNNFHWMASDYDFSTNNGSSTGGSAGNGWTGGLFINNPVPTGDTNAPSAQSFQLTTNSYFGYPTAFLPNLDPAGYGAVAQQSIDIYWPTNASQDTNYGLVANSIYRGGPYTTAANGVSDGVGTQVAGDSFVLPEFVAARTNFNDPSICEFNIGYFYATNWLNYTRTYPSGAFKVWGRLASGDGSFSGCTLSEVTNGVGTFNQGTQVLGTFSDASAAGWQTYHWIPLLDTNGNSVVVRLNGLATLQLGAPANATPSGDGLNPLFFMLAPEQAAPAFAISATYSAGNVQVSIPTQIGYNYTLWHSGSLNPANWTQVSGLITGDGSVDIVTQSTASQGYYRVTAQ
jgi:hypothetical protein